MPVCSCRVEFDDYDFAVVTIEISAVPPWTLAAFVPRLGAFRTEQRDLFDSLCRFREWLAVHNALILVQGAVRDVYPSGMMREAGGRTAYRLTLGQTATRDDVIDILAPAERSEIVDVKEQRHNFELWIKSVRSSGIRQRPPGIS